MRRNPSSGINEKDGEVILRFLLYYMHQVDQDDRQRDGTQPGESEVTPEGEPNPAPNAKPAEPAEPAPPQAAAEGTR
jgi:hypothetical protein